MPCVSTLRHVWPISLCVNYDSDEEEWSSPWPKASDKSAAYPHDGYHNPASSRDPTLQYSMKEKASTKVKTSRDRSPPMPSLPEQYYGIPANSRARSPESRQGRSRSRSASRNRLVKSRTQSMSSSRSRPSIGAPSDFRKVAGHDHPMMPLQRVPPMPPMPPMPPRDPANPPMDSWRRVSRRMSSQISRRVSFRPLELSFYQPGNELKPLPRFSRMILDPADASFLKELSSRPNSTVVRKVSNREARSRTRKSGSSHKSIAPRSTPVPKMPFIRHSRASSAGSDVSFDDAESVVDPDFNPTPARHTSRTASHKARPGSKMLDHIRPPVPLKTRSLLPSPREPKNKNLVSPVSPQNQPKILYPNSLKLDDLPSAFSSPATPTGPGWREAQDPFQNLDAAVVSAHQNLRSESVPYANNTTHRVSTPERSLNPQYLTNSPPRDEVSLRNSPTPSAASTISTVASNFSTSARSVSTAATSPPSPLMEPKRAVMMMQHPPKPLTIAPPASAPNQAQLREMTVQRVVADAPLLQPAPRIPTKSPRRLLPMIEEAQSPPCFAGPSEGDDQNVIGDGSSLPILHGNYGPQRLPQRPAPVAKPVGFDQPNHPQPQHPLRSQPQPQPQMRYPPQQQHQQPQSTQATGQPPAQKNAPPPRPARPDDAQLPPPQLTPPQKQQQSPKPQLHIQTGPPANAQGHDWTQTGSAWREVVWGLKRRTQDEMAFREREQQVVIDTVTASAHSDSDEQRRAREMQWTGGAQARSASNSSARSGPSPYTRPNHWRGGSGTSSNGSGDSHTATAANTESMEVPVGLALGGIGDAGLRGGVPPPQRPAQRAPPSQRPMTTQRGNTASSMMGHGTAEQSNDALLHLQPSVAHDMHAIAEEEEEEEEYKPPPKTMLSVRNGMPSQIDESESEDETEVSVPKQAPLSEPKSLAPQHQEQPPSQPQPAVLQHAEPKQPPIYAEDASDEEEYDDDGEEVEFGIDEGIWEMVESAPPSHHASIMNARESVTVVGIQDHSRTNSVSASSRRSRASSASGSRASSVSGGRSSSRNSMFIAPGAVHGIDSAPPMPSMPKDMVADFPQPPSSASATTPKTPTAHPAKSPQPPNAGGTAEQWGRGLGMEFGVAY